MKVALMAYHSNLSKIYPPTWVEEYRSSILAQTYKDFDIYECCYGKEKERIFDNSVYTHYEFPSFVHVMNYLLSVLFENGFDCVANSNVDDKFSADWIKKLLPYIDFGYDVASCNFVIFQDEKMLGKHYFDKLNIEEELNRQHNILCHPAILFNKTFWEKGNRYKPDEIPLEDLKLWQRAIKNSTFFIHPDHLCYHRLHSNSVCNSENR